LADEFSKISPDFRIKAAVDESNKNLKRMKRALVNTIDGILLPLEFAYGAGSQKLKELNFQKNADKRETNAILETANNLLTRLSVPENFSEATIPASAVLNLTNLLNNFKAEIENLSKAKQLRSTSTVKRVNLANDLYSEISKIAYYGKRYWMGIDPALNDTYVIDQFVKRTYSKKETETAA